MLALIVYNLVKKDKRKTRKKTATWSVENTVNDTRLNQN